MILGLDPGTTQSGWCLFDEDIGRVNRSGVDSNESLLDFLGTRAGTIRFAIETIDSYGMRVGREVFQTCIWIGRFVQVWRNPDAVRLVYRRDVTKYLLPPPKKQYKFATTDANIRQALIHKLGEAGTIGAGVKSHAWAALAVAVTALETK